ncbi:MAG: hypothetical protein AB7O74_14020 [Candidatus Nanopelagicales bacterium]
MSRTASRRSSRTATAVGATLVLLGAGLIVPSLSASAEESGHDGDHKVVVCHHVEGSSSYVRTVVDSRAIYGHKAHGDDVIGDEDETDLGCPGPTVSEVPEPVESESRRPSHEPTGSASHAPKPTHSESCSHSASPTPTDTEPETTAPATTEPATTEPATTEPATTEPATTEPATTAPATTSPATTDPATTDPATTEPAHPGLAQTGSNPLLPLVGGIALVLLGIAAMVLGRPRGTHA